MVTPIIAVLCSLLERVKPLSKLKFSLESCSTNVIQFQIFFRWVCASGMEADIKKTFEAYDEIEVNSVFVLI